MQQNLFDEVLHFSEYPFTFSVGDVDVLTDMQSLSPLEPFSDSVTDFFNTVSKLLLEDKTAKAYSDVITLAFWMRRASVEKMKERFFKVDTKVYHVGRGIAFHIAPSNVAVNYAYSLVMGLICGNANIVRLPSKDFPQVELINKAVNKALNNYEYMRPYIVIVKYGHDRAINDLFSSMADVRIIWGGNQTINEIRKSELKSRATEVTFADRYSLAVIDADYYLKLENQSTIAVDFYNDTYLTDQNACTSPRLVAWMGKSIDEAKKIFWDNLHQVVEEKYKMQGIQAVNKLTSRYMLATEVNHVNLESFVDNLIIRMKVDSVSADLMKFKDNSGYFFEYNCLDILDLKDLCNDTQCQTVSYIGDREMLLPLIKSGVKGIDRVVPVGKTMDFDLIWDGYQLVERLTRSISY